MAFFSLVGYTHTTIKRTFFFAHVVHHTADPSGFSTIDENFGHGFGFECHDDDDDDAVVVGVCVYWLCVSRVYDVTLFIDP
jgi:hypothetical protein